MRLQPIPKTKSIEIIANTTGWVGFGLTRSGGMTQSDVIIAGMDSLNGSYCLDGFVLEEKITPFIDTEQDWMDCKAEEKDGFTRVSFSRALQTGNETEDVDIEFELNHKVIYASGPEDPSAEGEIPKHTVKGKDSITLWLSPGSAGHIKSSAALSIVSILILAVFGRFQAS